MGVGLELATSRVGIARWRVVGASVEGTSHIATGVGCQDAHRVGGSAGTGSGGRLVIVAADGAGSAPRAREGAHHAVDAAYTAAEAGVDPCAAIAAARNRLEALATGQGTCEPAELAAFATTLTVVVVDEQAVVVSQIGDGSVVLRRPSGLALAIAPERSEYLNETRFVTSSSWSTDVRTCEADAHDIDGVAVMTDGLQLVAFDMTTDEPHPPFFGPLLDFATSPTASSEELAAFLGSPRVNERTDDDKTLVVAVRA